MQSHSAAERPDTRRGPTAAFDSPVVDGPRLRTLRPEDVPGVLRLLRNGWIKRALWDWQFGGAIETTAIGSPVVAEQDGQIVGFNGLMPVRVCTEHGVTEAGWSCDFIVNGAMRRAGLGRGLKRALDTQSSLTLAKGTSPAAARALPRCGWQEGRGPTQHVVHLGYGDLRGFACTVLRFLRRLTRRAPARADDARYHFVWTSELPADSKLDRLWSRCASGYRRAVVRDGRYLHWRYEQIPDIDYTFLRVEEDGRLCALFVMRCDGGAIRIVDYAGPAHAAALKSAAIGEACRHFDTATQLTITTTDPEFEHIARALGSLPSRSGAAGFFVRDVDGLLDRPADDWFLMDGDSDGEFLAAARAAAPAVRLNAMSDDEFERCAVQWERLRVAGGRDPLFMSWEWQAAWWRHFGRACGLTSSFMRAVTDDGTTVAIVPLIRWNAQARRFLPTRRLQLAGHLFQGPATMRTEYLDLLIDPDWEVPVVESLARWLEQDDGWDEYIVQDAPGSSAATGKLVELLSKRCYARELTEPAFDETRSVRTDRRFEDYLAALSANMRRALFNKRRKLTAKGRVTQRDLRPDEVGAGLDLLNALHAKRWGRPVFTDERLAFHKSIADAAALRGNLRLSVLELDGEPVSILYDLVAGARRYNLQQGFDPGVLGSKGSLGIIHFGYVIEACCGDPRIAHYDLLAGAGRRSLYKARMDTEAVSLRSTQLVRGATRKLVYRLHDRMR